MIDDLRPEDAMLDRPPYCECGRCHLEFLPQEAWAVAGGGDEHRFAVLPGHEARFRDGRHEIEDRGGWFAIGAVE